MNPFYARLAVKLPLLVVLATGLTAVVGSLIAIAVGQSVLRTEALDQSRERVALYASAIQFYVDHARSVLETTARFPLVRKLAIDRDLAGDVLRGAAVFEYVMLLQADGTVYLLEPESLERQLSHRDLSFHSWYKRVLQSGGSVVSTLHISPATQRPTVVLATPVRSPTGEIVGIWAGALKLAELSRIGRDASPAGAPAGYGYVTDPHGLIIAHQAKSSYVENQTDFSSVPTIREALAGHRGTVQFVNAIEGGERIGAYQRLAGLGWAVSYVVPVDVAFEPIQHMTRAIALASVAIAVLLAGLGALVAQRIVRPLKLLTTAVGQVGAGEFSERLDIRTGDEIERLSDEFNRMASDLANKTAQLQRRAEELQSANRELEAFSYSVSHDLRAPLRAMDGFSRILLEQDASHLSPQGHRYLRLVRENAVQMGHLVDDLLTFSRLSRQPLNRALVAPARLVQEILPDLRREHQDGQIDIMIGELPSCEADPALLRQVWTNLLSNALKFTRHRDPARIEIGARHDHGGPVYFVKDNGVGFDMRYADKLFGVFQRLHRAEDYEGTGVGLAIVQRIILRHGGQVWAEAKEDVGATFSFTIGPPDPIETEGGQ